MGGLSAGRVCLALMVALLGTCRWAEGGCQGKCCQGTDRSCTATDWRMDRVYGTCYCDDTCHRTKDCCFDYPTVCPGKNRHARLGMGGGCRGGVESQFISSVLICAYATYTLKHKQEKTLKSITSKEKHLLRACAIVFILLLDAHRSN